MSGSIDTLLSTIRACQLCAADLPHGVRPVVQAASSAQILIAGQAPGRIVHNTGIPWDDASGKRLRQWLGITPEVFYDASQVALVPMGFCYPGSSKSGDLPPRPECARTWHGTLLPLLSNLKIRIIIGQYALRYYLPERANQSLIEIVAAWRELPDGIIVVPHPSPRNQGWFKSNPWFEADLLPVLQARVRESFGS